MTLHDLAMRLSVINRRDDLPREICQVSSVSDWFTARERRSEKENRRRGSCGVGRTGSYIPGMRRAVNQFCPYTFDRCAILAYRFALYPPTLTFVNIHPPVSACPRADGFVRVSLKFARFRPASVDCCNTANSKIDRISSDSSF